MLARLGDIQDIVDDLEGQTKGLPEGRQGLESGGRGIGRHGSHPQGENDHRRGLALMDVSDIADPKFLPLGLQVGNLSRDQLQAASGSRHLLQQHGKRVSLAPLDSGNQSEGLRQQGVAGKHRDSLAEDLVRGGATAPEIIVIHAGKVIVNQRVGVDHLHGASRGEDRLQILHSTGFGGGQSQDGSQALAPGKQAVTYSLMDRGRTDGR